MQVTAVKTHPGSLQACQRPKTRRYARSLVRICVRTCSVSSCFLSRLCSRCIMGHEPWTETCQKNDLVPNGSNLSEGVEMLVSWCQIDSQLFRSFLLGIITLFSTWFTLTLCTLQHFRALARRHFSTVSTFLSRFRFFHPFPDYLLIFSNTSFLSVHMQESAAPETNSFSVFIAFRSVHLQFAASTFVSVSCRLFIQAMPFLQKYDSTLDVPWLAGCATGLNPTHHIWSHFFTETLPNSLELIRPLEEVEAHRFINFILQ